ncbi:MAG TPA: hypothetical protein VK840_05110 [Candidatus Dormibacteraeota bacterium]|jgi:hypothetical protein|nr:hypothetical protein [Candidatus Dormibacteraeota bacterium]
MSKESFMKNDIDKEIFYSMNIDDIQGVSEEILDRRLTEKEITLVKESVGEHIDWFQAIENAIQKHVHH